MELTVSNESSYSKYNQLRLSLQETLPTIASRFLGVGS